jgi:hypothetical protein
MGLNWVINGYSEPKINPRIRIGSYMVYTIIMQSALERFSIGAALPQFAFTKIYRPALRASKAPARIRAKREMQPCIERWENEGGSIIMEGPRKTTHQLFDSQDQS